VIPGVGGQPSLLKMLPTWVSTVLGDIQSWPAIAWLDRPSAIRASTSRSRPVRLCNGLSARGRATSRATTSGSITDSPRATRRIAPVNCVTSATRSLST